MDTFLLGMLLIAGGAIVILLLLVALRLVDRRRKKAPIPFAPAASPLLANPEEAELVVEIGGRVIFSNALAKEWFGFQGEEPNLERLARRTRPSDIFMTLCASEGQARFSLDGRLVDGASYFVPFIGHNGSSGTDVKTGVILVTLSRPQVAPVGPTDSSQSKQALDIFAELSRAMAASLDLEKTLQSILESVERLIPSDFPEITVWDPVNQVLVPYRFMGVAGVDRHLEKSVDRYAPDTGYSGHLVSTRLPLLIESVDAFREVRPAIDRKQYPFNSYLGIPLQVAGELIGTLELASLSKSSFGESDLEILRILSGQAAVALKNSLMFDEEQKRMLEMSGLARLSQAVGSLRDTQDLIARLVERITPLLPVKTLGFLLYDEGQRKLIAQKPFVGIPDPMVDLFQAPIPPGTPAETLWLSGETIITTNAPDDPRLEALGLNYQAKAAGIVNSVLIPLNSGGRQLGYLEAADKKDGIQLDQDDLRLLTIITTQVASTIENVELVEETQERAQRAEALRRMASLAASSENLDEILSFSLNKVAQLLKADFGVIFLLDESLGELHIHKESLYGVSEDILTQANRLQMTDPQFRSSVTGSLQPFFSGKAGEDQKLLPVFLPMVKALSIQSVLDVPLIIRNQGVGEIMLGSRAENFFDRSDLIMVSTAAGQLGGVIEKTTLYTQTDESLQRRVSQLLSLMRVGRELNSTLDLQGLLQLVYDEAIRATQADCGSILLFEPYEDSSQSPAVLYHTGDVFSGEFTPLDHKVLLSGEPATISNFNSTAVRNEGLKPPHAGIQCSLIVPITYQEKIAGLIHIHSRTPDRFDSTSLEIAQSLAVQAAIALGNVQRYQEQIRRTELLNRRVETLTTLLETTQNLQPEQPLEQSLEAIAFAIQETTPFGMVLISCYEAASGNLVRMASAGIPLEKFEELRRHTQPWLSVKKFLDPEFRFSRSYLIPHDRSPAIPEDVHVMTLISQAGYENPNNTTWHPDDMLLAPLETAAGEPLGLISVDAPRNGLRPDKPSIEALEVFANQAVLVIDTYNKLNDLSQETNILRQEFERAHRSAESARNSLPILLHKDLEQTIAIQQLSQRISRVQIGLEVSEIVNRQSNRPDILRTFGQELLARLDMSLVLITEPSEGGQRLMYTLGNLPGGISPQALLGQRNPLRTCMQTRQPIFVSNLAENAEWQGSPLLANLEAKAFICLPILAMSNHATIAANAVEIEAVLLAISPTIMPELTSEDEHTFELLTRQVTVALQNLRLLEETNRRLQEVNLLFEFSRQLGKLDTASILQSLVDSARQVIPAAHAGMVALWSPKEGSLVGQVAAGYIDNRKILLISYPPGQSLPGQAFEQGQSLRLAEVDFARDYNLTSDQLILYRDATEGRLPVSCLIIPIQTFDTKLGVLVLDNFKQTGAFTQEDQNLVTSLARQTALTLENARLYQASQERASQLQALTKVAGTITSSLQVNDLIASILDQIKSVLPFDTGTLWLRQGNRLTIRAAQGFADSEERVGLSVVLEDSRLLKDMITTSQPISVSDVRLDERFPSMIEHEYLSWLGLPLLSKGEVVGVIALEKTEAGFYAPEHIQAMVTFAGQSAVALENANLYEESVRRAAELDQRSNRLALLNRLSASLSGSLDLKNIYAATSGELRQAIHSSLISILIFDEENNAVLEAEAPLKVENLHLVLPANPVFNRLRETLGVFSTEDVRQEKDLVPIAQYLRSYDTRSLLILPLVSGNAMIGLVLVHSNETYRFSPEELELARTICNQASVAIHNARLFSETERLFGETHQRSGELASLFDLGVSLTQVLDESRLLELAFENVHQLFKADGVQIALTGEDGAMTVYSLERGLRQAPRVMERDGTSFLEYVVQTNQPLLVPDTQDEEKKPVQGLRAGDPCRCWLGVPLVARGAPTGVLSIQSFTAGSLGGSDLHLLGQIANQLSVAIDNAALFHKVQNYAADLELRVSERTEQLAHEHKRIQTLLSIISELSTSLDLDLVLNRTLGIINDTVSAHHSLILLVQPDGSTFYLRSALGYTGPLPKGGQTSTIGLDEGLAGWVVKHRQPVLVDDLWQDERWVRRDDKASLHRSALAVPLMVGEDILGVMLLYHRESGHFSSDQLDLVQATAKQIAVAINNAQLYNLIRDQAERLGDMLRTQHVETSRSQAILEAVADGVLVTDARRQITLFNASAEKILGLNRFDVLGHTLEHFMGLFGKAAQSWMQTIRTWSEDPEAYQPGDIYAEQIELDNRRVVAVHLSPVRLRNDFLGTVSIFRDITHQVEVDRLKSEFVATVSHELRTPMTSIKGYVEIMLMGASGALTDQQRHFLEVVKLNTDRLAVLVADLLDVSRIDAGRVTLSLQPVDLSQVADGCIETISQRMKDENRPMHFSKDIPDDLPLVNGDLERVRQMLDNLLENAYQYTDPGGEIVVRARQAGDQVQVDVQDNGIGISAEDRPRIFERFFRGEDPLVLATSGNGLGLSIVKKMVEMHQGKIWFESQGIRGEGSIFSFFIPIYVKSQDKTSSDTHVRK